MAPLLCVESFGRPTAITGGAPVGMSMLTLQPKSAALFGCASLACSVAVSVHTSSEPNVCTNTRPANPLEPHEPTASMPPRIETALPKVCMASGVGWNSVCL
ncbi:MAG: hypothetical protein EBR71_05405 [Planctomycetes bacterium]|nr:hypothetical protein [Planctomycetota bacterium]